MNRRKFLKNSSLLTGGAGLVLSCHTEATVSSNPSQYWRMPDEGAPHERTWMAFGASASIWGRQLLPEAQRNLATVANAIVRYEPVSMLVREKDQVLARSLLDSAIDLVVANLDDLWMRDTGPIFVFNEQGEKAAVDFNFNGWGEKQTYQNDAQVAALIADYTRTSLIETSLVLEGGCLEVDGQGNAIITESCVINDNRNPALSKAEIEDILIPLLGLRKIIWLPGIKGQDITDGHTDFYARFAKPGVVVAGYEPDPTFDDHEITLEHLEILEAATDADGKKLRVEVLEAPQTIRETYASDDFAAGYIGYYLCNDAVIMQEFGDSAADTAARETLQNIFPERTVEAIAIDGIAAGGGSIHCTTQQEPLLTELSDQRLI